MSDTPDKPIVCYVTDRKSLGSADPIGDLRARIRLAIAAGVDWVQIREKDLPARALLAIVREAVETGPARVIVNDRLDVSLAAGAAGVHLGRESAPVEEVVTWGRKGNAPGEFLIGVSCHSPKDARDAEEAGASYVFFGPVFEHAVEEIIRTRAGISAAFAGVP